MAILRDMAELAVEAHREGYRNSDLAWLISPEIEIRILTCGPPDRDVSAREVTVGPLATLFGIRVVVSADTDLPDCGYALARRINKRVAVPKTESDDDDW